MTVQVPLSVAEHLGLNSDCIPASSFMLMPTLGGSRNWLHWLSPCHAQEDLDVVPTLQLELGSAPAVESIWGTN